MRRDRFQIGNLVEPKPEWKDDPNRVPSGCVIAIAPWGDDGALYVEGERRAFAGYVFQPTERKTMTEMMNGKAVKFRTLAEKRVSRALKTIRQIGALARPKIYEYTPQQLDQMFAALHAELEKAEAEFAPKQKAAKVQSVFSFE